VLVVSVLIVVTSRLHDKRRLGDLSVRISLYYYRSGAETSRVKRRLQGEAVCDTDQLMVDLGQQERADGQRHRQSGRHKNEDHKDHESCGESPA
jgi:hypothetical protein